MTIKRIEPADVEIAIKDVLYWRPEDTRVMVCCIITESGNAIIGEAHAQVSTEWRDAVGMEWAYKDAFDKLYKHEVYVAMKAALPQNA